MTEYDGDNSIDLNFLLEVGYPIENRNLAEKYSANGYPTVIDTPQKALKVRQQYEKAEQVTIDRMTARTRSRFPQIMQYLVDTGRKIKMVEVPISELSHIQGSQERTNMVKEVVKSPEDLSKLPPPVLSMHENGAWTTVDGQARIAAARETGAESIIGYYIDEDDRQEGLIYVLSKGK